MEKDDKKVRYYPTKNSWSLETELAVPNFFHLALLFAIPRLASQSARNEKGRRLGPWPSQTAPSRGVRLSNPADAPVRVWQWWGRLMGCVAEIFVAQWQSTCSVWLIAVAGPERTLAQSGRLLQSLLTLDINFASSECAP